MRAITPLGEDMGLSPTLENKVKYPGKWWNENSSEKYKRKFEGIVNSLKTSNKMIICDNDLDGLGSVAVLEHAYGSESVSRAVVEKRESKEDCFPAITINVCAKILSKVGSDEEVFMVDLCPNDENVDEILSYFENHDGKIHVYDHHEWDKEVYDRFDEVVDEMDIRTGENMCGADILYDNISNDIDKNKSTISRFVAAVRDHDIWIKEAEESYDLADLHYELDENEFIEAVKHYGADIMNCDYLREIVKEKRWEKNAKMEYQVKNSDWYFFSDDGSFREINSTEEIIGGGFVVAVSYGTAYHSGVGNVLCCGWEEWSKNSPFDRDGEMVDEVDYSTNLRPGDADIAVIVKPWNKVSFRSSEEAPICHELAKNWGGGGHEEAAGCKPGYVNLINTSAHWRTEGRFVKEKVLDGMSEVISKQKKSTDF